MICHHLYVGSKKEKTVYKTEIDSDTENKLMITKGDWEGGTN